MAITPRLYGPLTAGNIQSAFLQVFDPNQVSTDGSQTGMWRGVTTGDLGGSAGGGGGSVTILNPVVAVSGVVQATVIAELANLAVTGGNLDDLTSQRLLSGISGVLATNINGAVWVTGGIVQTTGSFQILNTSPIAVTGTNTNTITGWNTGNLVQTHYQTAAVTTNSIISGTSPWTGTSTAVYVFTGQVFAANPNRVKFFIQNIHTGMPLYVNLGTAAASTGSFSFILNPSTVQYWAGASASEDSYRGAVCASGGGWTAWEL